MIKEQEVKPIREDLYCDECGYIMTIYGDVLASFPPKYTYVCNQCTHRVTTSVFYPNYKYVPIEE